MYDNVAIITENVLQSPKSYSLDLILGYLKYLIKGWVWEQILKIYRISCNYNELKLER